MPARKPAACEVGYLVLLETGAGKLIYRKLILGGIGLFADGLDFTCGALIVQRRPRLVSQTVSGDMLRTKIERRPKRTHPEVFPPARYCKDQIERNIFKTRLACIYDSLFGIVGGMCSAQKIKLVLVERLCADAKTVDL